MKQCNKPTVFVQVCFNNKKHCIHCNDCVLISFTVFFFVLVTQYKRLIWIMNVTGCLVCSIKIVIVKNIYTVTNIYCTAIPYIPVHCASKHIMKIHMYLSSNTIMTLHKILVQFLAIYSCEMTSHKLLICFNFWF